MCFLAGVCNVRGTAASELIREAIHRYLKARALDVSQRLQTRRQAAMLGARLETDWTRAKGGGTPEPIDPLP